VSWPADPLEETSDDVSDSSHKPADLRLVREVPFVDLGGEYRLHRDEFDRAIGDVLERSDFVLGDAVDRFEDEFARYCETSYAVGVDSGFAAIELILRAMGIGRGDEVITAANSFVASAFAISACGARPVLVDVDPATYNLDPQQLEAAITPRTAAVLPVHLYGQPAEMGSIGAIASRHHLAVVEDACQAHGARYRGRRTGSLGRAAAFSFFPSKNLGAFGDGGMVVTNDETLAAGIRKLRNVGSTVKYRHEVLGFNHRLDTLQAAALAVKLRYLDADNDRRRMVAVAYERLLADLPLRLPMEASSGEHVYHLYVVALQDRDRLAAHLDRAGVRTGIHYPIPIHLQPAYHDLGYRVGDFPVSEWAAGSIVSLPMFPRLSPDDVGHVTRSIRNYYGH